MWNMFNQRLHLHRSLGPNKASALWHYIVCLHAFFRLCAGLRCDVLMLCVLSFQTQPGVLHSVFRHCTHLAVPLCSCFAPPEVHCCGQRLL